MKVIEKKRWNCTKYKIQKFLSVVEKIQFVKLLNGKSQSTLLIKNKQTFDCNQETRKHQLTQGRHRCYGEEFLTKLKKNNKATNKQS